MNAFPVHQTIVLKKITCISTSGPAQQKKTWNAQSTMQRTTDQLKHKHVAPQFDAHVLSRGKRTLGRVLVPSTVEASCESLFSRRTSSKILSSSPASSESRYSIRRRSLPLRSLSPGNWIPDGNQLRDEPLVVGRASSRHCNMYD